MTTDRLKIILSLILFLLFLITPGMNDAGLANSTISSKTFFFLFAVIVISGLLLCLLLIGKNSFQVACSKIDVALALWLGYVLLNRYVIQADHGFSLRFMELLGLSALYIILRYMPPRLILLLFPAVILSGIVQAVYGAMQLTGFLPSVNSTITGSFQNSGPYAGYLAVTGCLACSIYLFNERLAAIITSGHEKYTALATRSLEWIAFAGMASAIIMLPATRSRAAWLSMGVGLTCLLLYRYKRLFLPVAGKIVHAATSIKLLLAGGLFLLFALGGYSVYQLKKDSADGRMLVWKVTARMIKEQPAFGVGFDRFKTHYMNAQAAYFEKEDNSREVMLADNTYYAFNETLQILAESGVVGFLLLGIAVILWCRVRVNVEFRLLKAIALLVILSVFVFGLFSYPMQLLPVKMLLVLLLALLANLDRETFNISKFIPTTPRPALRWSVSFVGVAIAAGLFYEVYKVQTAFKRSGQALVIYNYESYAESLIWFEKAHPELRKDGDFLMNYGKSLAMAGEYGKAITMLSHAQNHINTTVIETALGDAYKALKQYKQAEVAYTRASRMAPNRFYPEYLLARLYQDSGQKDKAYKKAAELLVKEVKIPSKAIDEIKEEMKTLAGKTKPGN